MMVKLLVASQLASQPTGVVEIQSQFPQDRAGWYHVINLSPYVFELQDDEGLVRTVVSAFRERAVRLKVRTDRLLLVAVATEATDANFPAGSYVVYGELQDQQPLMQGALVT